MNILFICTHNACRSVLGEVITRELSNGRIATASAGSSPAGRVDPLTLKYLEANNYSTDMLNSESLEDATKKFIPDIIITVCDRAAREACPVIFDETIKHWGLIVPSHLADDSISEEAAFNQVINTIEKRIQHFLSKPFEQMDRESLQTIINETGELF
ncbi:MAG: arsenate reductase ArsC [Cycloclasticus sp.]|nr:arsenate reductase ArsC [Cycloclasticus sp.]